MRSIRRRVLAACCSRRPATRRAVRSASTTIRSSTRPRMCSTSSTSRAGRGRRLSWRYDSGLVSSAIGDVLDLLPLTPAQQAAAGMACGGVPATPQAGFSSCAPGSITTTRLVVPAAGTGDPLNNPSRVAPRHLFDLGLGTDNLLRRDKAKLRRAVQHHQSDQQGRARTTSSRHSAAPTSWPLERTNCNWVGPSESASREMTVPAEPGRSRGQLERRGNGSFGAHTGLLDFSGVGRTTP